MNTNETVNHGQEPWHYYVCTDMLCKTERHSFVVTNNQRKLFSIPSIIKRHGLTSGGWVEQFEDVQLNVARMVACVNACAGINPDAVPDLLRLARMVATLNEKCLEIGKGRMLEMVTTARAAIGKAEGESCAKNQ